MCCINIAENLFCNCGVKFVITTSQRTCFASGLVDYALLLCRKFAAKLPHQVCHDKLQEKSHLLQVCMLWHHRGIWQILNCDFMQIGSALFVMSPIDQ
ncbi:hypothetical protein AVEN_44576-1 [Araneus ventricosus]|uniref:Uncharacterized protein n=1 Tax=Araneus ventricosus TaxID=182803 RepID=A0A4Y2IM41_ARAVE|nr:hypothetical protein AVEN_44576-1 [Araneus ventricosus]